MHFVAQPSREKLASIGIERGRMMDIRNLEAIGRDYGIGIYLFFEKELATTRTLAEVQADAGTFPSTSARMSGLIGFSGSQRKTTRPLTRRWRSFPS